MKIGLIFLSMVFISSSASYTIAGDIEHNSRCVERYNRCTEKCNVKITFEENRQCINDCWEDYQWCLKD